VLSDQRSFAQIGPPAAAFVVYSGALIITDQVDLTHYLDHFGSGSEPLGPTAIWHCLRPVLPLMLIQVVTPRPRWKWLWAGWIAVAALTLFWVQDSAQVLDPKLRTMAVTIYALPFVTWPMTALVVVLAWRDLLLRRFSGTSDDRQA
jgi:hypothetical protein